MSANDAFRMRASYVSCVIELKLCIMGCMTELRSGAVTDFDRTTALLASRRTARIVLWSIWTPVGRRWSACMADTCARSPCGVPNRCAEDRAVRTVTTSFLRTGAVGPAVLSVREVRRGRSMSTVVADAGTGRPTVLLSSRLTRSCRGPASSGLRRRRLDLPPVERCVPMDAGACRSLRAGRRCCSTRPGLPFSGGDRAMVQGYLRPLEDRRVDSAWLAMATDWFPPPAFVRLEPPTGGVSIDLTTHVHQPRVLLGDDEWLCARFEIHEPRPTDWPSNTAVITTDDGTPVAESLQTRLTAQD